MPNPPLADTAEEPKMTLAANVATPPNRELPETLAVPVTARVASGAVLPMPTLPEISTVILSRPAVLPISAEFAPSIQPEPVATPE